MVCMSRNIAVSDDVYRALKREKGDRSFSEVIADHLESGGKLDDVVGAGVLDREVQEDVREEVERMSEGTLSRVDDETL